VLAGLDAAGVDRRFKVGGDRGAPCTADLISF
jgi:hypothetical protein